MKRTRAAIIGGGQAGLAMSHCLVERGVDHVVFERGNIAERWRSERWDSLRLLTPNWQSRLPGFSYDGSDPDGYMSADDVVEFLDRYARSFAAPMECHTIVRAVQPHARGFRILTDGGTWDAETVVIATGHADLPRIPEPAQNLAPDIDQLPPSAYRRPSQLREGGVLVVGASATGIQLAQELGATGRRVVLAVGRHTRVPRCYRGKDILWWLARTGILDETERDVFNLEISRDQASFQLVGRPDHASIDLAQLQEEGVEIVGHLQAVSGHVVRFADDLIVTTVAADIRLANLLNRIDEIIDGNSGAATCAGVDRFEPIWQRFMNARQEVDLRASNINTVIWATGFKRSYRWLHVPGLLDSRGEIQHHGGVSVVPGVYVLGLQFLRHRNSSFIDGVGRDAVALADHLERYLAVGRAVA